MQGVGKLFAVVKVLQDSQVLMADTNRKNSTATQNYKYLSIKSEMFIQSLLTQFNMAAFTLHGSSDPIFSLPCGTDRIWLTTSGADLANVSTSSKKLDLVTKLELVIKTCSVNAAYESSISKPKVGTTITII